jgi:hypothetical protein
VIAIDARAVALVVTLSAGWLAVQHWRGQHVGIRDADEIAWVLTAPYLDLLTHRDDPRWLGREALNHPPFAKLLMGVVIPRAHWPESLEAKERWLDDQWIVPRAGEHFMRDAQLVPAAALARGRQLSLAAMVIALVFATLCALEAFGATAALWTALWVGTSPLSIYLARLAVSDAILLAALAASAFFTLRLRRETDLRSAVVFAIALGVCAGCAGQTKLNGLATLPLCALALMAGRLTRGCLRRRLDRRQPGADDGSDRVAPRFAGAAIRVRGAAEARVLQ